MAQPPPSNGTPRAEDRDRRAAESPPGSSARAESDATGWSVERDEPPEQRQGRFHRAAQMRMGIPRTETGAPGRGGPYGPDDRAESDAAGRGPGTRMGEQDWDLSHVSHPRREYRAWSRTDVEPPPPERPGARGPEPRRRWTREPLTAREVMTRPVRGVLLEAGLHEVARLMKDEDCGVIPVVDAAGRLRGVITDRDLVLRVLAEGRAPETLKAREVMSEDVQAVLPQESLPALIALMGRHQVRRLPVVESDDRLVGIISLADIATRAENDEELQEALQHVSARRSFWSRLT